MSWPDCVSSSASHERPLLLDCFCGCGGAGMGFHRAGFEVVGVDIEPQPNYPFAFVQADLTKGLPEGNWKAVHASPPCQGYSDLRWVAGRAYSGLVELTRALLQQSGLPYVIENVQGAPLRDPITLCGSSFGLQAGGRQLRRHRLFECSFPVGTWPCLHRGQPVGVYGSGGGGQQTRGYRGDQYEYEESMGITWATRSEIAQALPPAYTEYIGHALMRHLGLRD